MLLPQLKPNPPIQKHTSNQIPQLYFKIVRKDQTMEMKKDNHEEKPTSTEPGWRALQSCPQAQPTNPLPLASNLGVSQAPSSPSSSSPQANSPQGLLGLPHSGSLCPPPPAQHHLILPPLDSQSPPGQPPRAHTVPSDMLPVQQQVRAFLKNGSPLNFSEKQKFFFKTQI